MLAFFVVAMSALATHAAAAAAAKPNIIFILSDDLGFGEYEGAADSAVKPPAGRRRIQTPHIKAMAAAGMVFETSYSGPICAPSRCMLMSGKHGGHCSVRGNDGSYSPMPANETTVGKLLSQKGGYVTGVVGKWGEGDHGTTGYPLGEGGGFDEFLGQDTQVGCHNWYPWSNTTSGGALWNMSGPLLIPANTMASYKSCSSAGTTDLKKCTWANDLYKQEGHAFIRRHAHGPKPFFLYLSTTTPHAGFLEGQYGHEGWPVPDAAGMAKFNSGAEYKSWPQTMKNVSAAIWAQDEMVGDVQALLDTLRIKDNTVLMFSGDNGPPSGRNLVFFNSQGPFRGYKSTIHEGGVRQSVVVQWPAQIKTGVRNAHHIFTFWDLLPTCAELAGIPKAEWPAVVDGVSAVSAMLGTDNATEQLLPGTRIGGVGAAAPFPVRPDAHPVYYEFCWLKVANTPAKIKGQGTGPITPTAYADGWGQALRWMQWKGIRANRGIMILYDLQADVGEKHDVASRNPDVVKTIASKMEEQHVEDKWWPSTHQKPNGNGSEPVGQCCGNCFKEGGCGGGCTGGKPSPPSPPPGPPVALKDLAGTWRANDEGGAVTFTLSLGANASISIVNLNDSTSCWTTCTGGGYYPSSNTIVSLECRPCVKKSVVGKVTSRKNPAQLQISWRVSGPDDGGEHPASEGWPFWTKTDDVTLGDIRIHAPSPSLVWVEPRGPKGFEDRTTAQNIVQIDVPIPDASTAGSAIPSVDSTAAALAQNIVKIAKSMPQPEKEK